MIGDNLMDLKFTKADKKITEIIARLYLRYYSLADIFDYINGKDILEIFYERLEEHIKKIPKDISNIYNVSKGELLKIIKKEDEQGVAILKFKIKDIIERYEDKQEFSKKKINIIKDLKNDIKEIEELLNQEKERVNFSKEEKKNSTIYQMLKKEDYKNLKRMKLDI